MLYHDTETLQGFFYLREALVLYFGVDRFDAPRLVHIGSRNIASTALIANPLRSY